MSVSSRRFRRVRRIFRVLRRQKSGRDRSSKRAKSQGPATCRADAPPKPTGSFSIKSSLGAAFLVISDCQLVQGVPNPSRMEWQELLRACTLMVDQWESGSGVLLVDFEGEFTGLEGELVCAAFQRTFDIDARGLRPMMGGRTLPNNTGLLVDLRCQEAAAIARRIMESQAITKIIWGADGDLTSLRYTPAVSPLGIASASVVDAQLAFSSAHRRLSMTRMLERVPPNAVRKLPRKDSMDWDTAHAQHRRALPVPFALEAATYAIDDLHRLEIVLKHQRPSNGNYLGALSQTIALAARLENQPLSVTEPKLNQMVNQFHDDKKTDLQRLAIAVRIKRHLIALRLLEMSGEDHSILEAAVDELLHREGVSIPSDLAFLT